MYKRQLPDITKNSEEITITLRDGEVIDAESGNTEREKYGVAVYIGTTTVVIMLWNVVSLSLIHI